MKLASRFSLLFALLALAAAAALTLVWGGLLDRAAQRQAERRLRAEVALLADSAAPLFDAPERLDRLVRLAGERLGVRVTAIEPDGRVVSDSDVRPEEVPAMENHAGRPEVLEARRTGIGSSRRMSATLDREFLYLAGRVDRGGRIAGYVRMAIPADELHAEESPTVWLGRIAIFGACLALFLIGSAASRRLAEPIRRATEAAVAVADGDLTREAPEESEPEAAALSLAVRRMKASLLESLSRVRSQRELVAAVLDSLPDAICVIDPAGRIEQSNRAFRRLMGEPQPEGRPLVDFVRHPDVHATLSRAREGGRGQVALVRREDGRAWEVHALPLGEPATERLALILRDVTPVIRNEEMRRRFVADVSHELRTPVASIAAAAETLVDRELPAAEREELARLVLRQSERMRDLISDLTDLSRIESGAVELARERVVLSRLAAEVAEDLRGRAAEAHVRIEITGEEGATVDADPRRLRQMIHNLVDNAVKFSPEGETVTLAVVRRAGSVGLEVADRGPGVPVSEREKIFQRFYQVDPSRSKAKPGTGLGLAIVKHLAQMQGIEIEVGGEEGKGAVFRLVFSSSAS